MKYEEQLHHTAGDNSYNHKILNEKKLFTLSLPLLLYNALMGADREDEIQDATKRVPYQKEGNNLENGTLIKQLQNCEKPLNEL